MRLRIQRSPNPVKQAAMATTTCLRLGIQVLRRAKQGTISSAFPHQQTKLRCRSIRAHNEFGFGSGAGLTTMKPILCDIVTNVLVSKGEMQPSIDYDECSR